MLHENVVLHAKGIVRVSHHSPSVLLLPIYVGILVLMLATGCSNKEAQQRAEREKFEREAAAAMAEYKQIQKELSTTSAIPYIPEPHELTRHDETEHSHPLPSSNTSNFSEQMRQWDEEKRHRRMMEALEQQNQAIERQNQELREIQMKLENR